MLLSRILNDMNYNDEYRIIAEKPFRYLALTASNLKDEHAVFLDDVKYADSIKKNVSMVITTKGVAEGLRARRMEYVLQANQENYSLKYIIISLTKKIMQEINYRRN